MLSHLYTKRDVPLANESKEEEQEKGEGEEEGGSKERFEEGGEGEGGTIVGMQINCIPLLILPGNHNRA